MIKAGSDFRGIVLNKVTLNMYINRQEELGIKYPNEHRIKDICDVFRNRSRIEYSSIFFKEYKNRFSIVLIVYRGKTELLRVTNNFDKERPIMSFECIVKPKSELFDSNEKEISSDIINIVSELVMEL